MITIYKLDKNILINEHRVYVVGIVEEGDKESDSILFYDLDKIPSGVPKLVDGVIVPATEEDLFNWGMVTYEDLCNKLKRERVEIFRTVLIYDVAVLNGEQEQTLEERELRDKFKKEWLDITEKVDKTEYKPVERPIMPEFMVYYQQFK
ncbi:hypothetical protein M2102_003313 [Fusobacterium sp. PH5-7]|uniref:hypothetical protein n=1 Tax=Fusobacterium sp. PH5-7 TaxID=2940528 RepID=UPI002473DC8B|nr:hypothetical protein [Fusobacterium sp. PH5-7]MDH6459651.1 hypothetical protein [Fusobacterium sp. PH5-7]